MESILLRHFVGGLLELRTQPVTPARTAGERPTVFAPARLINQFYNVVPNLYHDGIHLEEPLERRLMALLDGTRTRAELMSALGASSADSVNGERLEAALAALAQKAILAA